MNQEKAVELIENGHKQKPFCLTILGLSQHDRFNQLGKLSDLENAISNQDKAIKLTNDRHPSKPHISQILVKARKVTSTDWATFLILRMPS